MTASDRPVGLDASNWDRGPFNRWSFQHVDRLVETVEVPCRPDAAHPLPFRPLDLAGLPFRHDGEIRTIGRWLDDSYTDGFLFLSGGAIHVEDYRNGMTTGRLHLLQSVSKSVTAAAAAPLFEAGQLDPEAPIVDVLPELASTGWQGARLRHVLDMTSGTVFDETYDAPASHCAFLDAAAGWKPFGGEHWPRTVHDLIVSLVERERPHGEAFRYRSIETDILALAMERVGGERLPGLISRHVWQPMGAECTARITVDRTGYAAADGGLNACLRDLGRFGLMMASRGRVGDRQVIPEAFIDDCLAGDPALFGAPYTDVLPRGAYRNQFWIEEAGGPVLLCRGVFGQLVYIDTATGFVGVKLSSWPVFTDPPATRMALAAMRAIRDALT